MPEDEFYLWLRYFAQEPPLAQRIDIQFANLASHLMNTIAAVAGGRQSFALQDVGLLFPLQPNAAANDEDDTPLYLALQNQTEGN